ncbi:MAG: thioredoxin [Bacteroidaceae bacterium]|nr:thioredoxin [Bacteroidaceae bacterium]
MATFNSIIATEPLVLVDFFATWCQPCKTMHPVLDQLKQQLGTQIRILKVDIDKNEAVASHYGVQSVPTLFLFHNGELVWRQSGAQPLSALKAVVRPYL